MRERARAGAAGGIATALGLAAAGLVVGLAGTAAAAPEPVTATADDPVSGVADAAGQGLRAGSHAAVDLTADLADQLARTGTTNGAAGDVRSSG